MPPRWTVNGGRVGVYFLLQANYARSTGFADFKYITSQSELAAIRRQKGILLAPSYVNTNCPGMVFVRSNNNKTRMQFKSEAPLVETFDWIVRKLKKQVLLSVFSSLSVSLMSSFGRLNHDEKLTPTHNFN
jgi:hypothetical protein